MAKLKIDVETPDNAPDVGACSSCHSATACGTTDLEGTEHAAHDNGSNEPARSRFFFQQGLGQFAETVAEEITVVGDLQVKCADGCFEILQGRTVLDTKTLYRDAMRTAMELQATFIPQCHRVGDYTVKGDEAFGWVVLKFAKLHVANCVYFDTDLDRALGRAAELVVADEDEDGPIDLPPKALGVPHSKATTDNPKDLIGETKPALSCVPMVAILHMAKAMMDGVRKYGLFNWRKKHVRSDIYVDAAMRHIIAWNDGEETAGDSGVHHLGHAMACLGILLDAQATESLIDNRSKSGRVSELIAELTEKPNADS